LRYFPSAPIKKEYVVLSRKMLSGDIALKEFIEMSMLYIDS